MVSARPVRLPRPAVSQRWLGGLLLGVFFALGVWTLNQGSFVDEADNLAVGRLLAGGARLYADVFSHHFPLPYYWTAAGVWAFGPAVFAIRWSLLAGQMVAFAVAMRLSRGYLTVGGAAVLWGLVRVIYRGNLVLYNAFAAAAVAVVLAVTVAVLSGRTPATPRRGLAFSLAASVALLSDPLTVYVIGVSLAMLAVRRWRWALGAGAGVAAVAAAYGAWLAATGTVTAFWEHALRFNVAVYGQYLPTQPWRLADLLSQAGRALDLFNPTWWDLDPWRPVANWSPRFDQWVFTGALYRVAVLAAVGALLARRRWAAATYLYLAAAALLVISPGEFRGQPFVLAALLSGMAAVTGEWWPAPAGVRWRPGEGLIRLGLAVALVWLGARVGGFLLAQRHQLGYPAHFAALEQRAAEVRALACDAPEAALAYYPAGTYYHWFTGLRPVSRYVFMWPWVAEVGLAEDLAALQAPGALALVVVEEASIWGLYDTRVYLQPLTDYLAAHYVPLAAGVYRSPALQAWCASRP